MKSAIDSIERVLETSLINEDLRYCLVDENKIPFKIDNKPASPNMESDFIPIYDLGDCLDIDKYSGIGISVQASKVWAIDVDHCFSIPNNLESGDTRANELLEIFKDTYCEFSFSGTGLRILLRTDQFIKNYKSYFYIKNEKLKLEVYQPLDSFRYVTVTGNSIFDNKIKQYNLAYILKFLEKYMQREKKIDLHQQIETETKSFDELFVDLKKFYMKNVSFQDLWFSTAPGSGHDESERDYHILNLIFENITKDKDMIAKLFETSPYYKSKDNKHINKWKGNNQRYWDYVYNSIVDCH